MADIKNELGAIDLTEYFKQNISYRISFGNVAFDRATGGGVPCSKLTEIYGDFSSGKTRVACHLLAETQKAGGKGVLLDTERALEPGLVALTGLDLSTEKIIYPDPAKKLDSIEDVFKMIGNSIKLLREENPNGLLTIVWDSVATAPGLEDLENEIGNNMAAARRAKLISDGLKKIMKDVYKHKIALVFINQIREKIGVLYGEKVDTIGGKALKFQASLRIHLKIAGKLKDEKTEEIAGYKGRFIVEKSRVCEPFHRVEFEMYKNKSIDKYDGLLDYMVRHSELNHLGAGWYQFAGQEDKFRKDDFEKKYEEFLKIKGD